jgi:hypothetical protein
VWPDAKGGDHETLSQYELCRFTKGELSVLLHQIANALRHLPEGSVELRSSHLNLHNIRKALARPDFRPR